MPRWFLTKTHRSASIRFKGLHKSGVHGAVHAGCIITVRLNQSNDESNPRTMKLTKRWLLVLAYSVFALVTNAEAPRATGRQESLVINVTEHGVLFVDGKRLAFDQLRIRLSRLAAERLTPVIIRFDAKTPMGEITRAMDACKDAGFKQIRVQVITDVTYPELAVYLDCETLNKANPVAGPNNR